MSLLARIRWSVYISKSKTDSNLCIYHFIVWSNFNFLYNSQWITFPTQSCLVLYYLSAILLHSLIMWLMALSLSPCNLHLLFCGVILILALIYLFHMTLFCAAIRKDSVFLLRLPFQVFSYEILLVCLLKYPYSCFSSHFSFQVIVVLFVLMLSVMFIGCCN